jgi:ABC-2 type transport system ATP-binding protein
MPVMIEAAGLSKYYGSFVAVHDISFSIPQGQVVAFLGPNGAGKTTMMRMLTGYLAPSAGEAAIAGHDVRQDRIAASRRLGYLPENGPMYPDMTPLELLRFFGEARRMAPATMKERVEAVVELCALELVTEKPIGKLSRGYRQRVGMAQALLHDPDVLIMDEPTAGLDPNQIRQFRENIQRLGRTKTLLISTHILHEAEAVADRVLLVNSGRLVFDGPVDDLKEDGSLEQPFYRLTAAGAPPASGDGSASEDGGSGKTAVADDGEAATDENAAAGDAGEKTDGAGTAVTDAGAEDGDGGEQGAAGVNAGAATADAGAGGSGEPETPGAGGTVPEAPGEDSSEA